jgi:predicted dehydrogenase
MDRIGVGVIGASVRNPGWATAVHIPAIRASDAFTLRAVSTSTPASAAAAAAQFGVQAFDNADDLIAAPDVDLVVVAVKVPHHHEIIAKALAAGKNVFSEWPLAANLSEAEDLSARATASDLRTMIGLQARFSPAIRRAKDLVQDGAIGEILATDLAGSGMAWGGTTDLAHAYMFRAGSGASTASVPLMHALDALIYVLGDFDDVSAASSIRRPIIVLTDGTGTLQNTSPDHVSVSGRLRCGAIASILYRGGTSRAGNLRWEINGTDGDLLFTAANGNIQVADIELRIGRKDAQDMTELLFGGQSGALDGNVARLYQAIAQDIRDGTSAVPDFPLAVERPRLLAAIEASGVVSLD